LDKVFHIRAFSGTDRDCREVDLDLPATDYELLDLMDQLQPEDASRICLEIHAAEEYNYLDNKMREPGLLQLNTLASRLAELDIQGMAAFEGLVCMDLQKGEKTISVPLLIDYAHSGDCCHVVGDAVTDADLGRFLAENDFVPDVDSLSDAAFELLDFQRIGKTHREAEGGAFTGFGYVERQSEIHCVSKTMDFLPGKPPYTILVNMAALPLAGDGRKPEVIQLRLPAPEEQLRETLEKLGKPDWKDVAVSIQDCALPCLNHEMYFNGETPQILELSHRLSELDAKGRLTRYKAILAAEDCSDLSRMISLAGMVDEYFFESKVSSPEDMARDELKVVIGDKDAKTLMPYIDLHSYGRALLERDHATITGYGLVERENREQAMEQQPGQGGMDMI